MIRAGVAAVVVIAGLFVAGSGDEVRTIEVTLEHSRFIPDHIEVNAGETVRFVVRNNDPIDHEFLIGDTVVQLAHEYGTEPHHGARPGEISIAAQETETTTYTFGERGRTLFGCHLPGHYDYGMKGTISIEPARE